MDKEVKPFASPYPNVRTHSDSRPIWYPRWVLPEAFCVCGGLFALEELVFTCALLNLATLAMRSPSSFSAQDREPIVARPMCISRILQDEFQHFRVFARLSDETWVVSEGFLAHVKSVLESWVPIECGVPLSKHLIGRLFLAMSTKTRCGSE